MANSKPKAPTIPDNITGIALELGADVAGVAPVERFSAEGAGSYLPTGYLPTELLPGARSVIVVAARVLDGVLASALEPLDTTFAYGTFGYVHVNRRLGAITYDLASRLEQLGAGPRCRWAPAGSHGLTVRRTLRAGHWGRCGASSA